ncbi:MAG: CRISPR-associated helicase Cas3' [Chloracidobacterium sp.]
MGEQRIEQLIKFWGKAGKEEEKEEEKKAPPYHSVLCHVIDVALVAEALLLSPATRPPGFLESLTGSRCSSPLLKVIRWVAFIVSLHDVGKISPGFQKKRPDLVNQFLPKDHFPYSRQDEPDHGLVTLLTLPNILSCLGQIEDEVAEPLARAVGGHHGSFPAHPSLPDEVGKQPWETARKELVQVLAEVFELAWDEVPFTPETLTGSFLMTLAGLTTVADWIGSDERWFPYTGDQITDMAGLKAYVAERREVAQQAVMALHLGEAPFRSDDIEFASLFAHIPNFAPNQCQQTARSVAGQLTGPSLLIIETPMGSGKTEAALGVADMWMRQRGMRGLYYALPTQATGNQMFKRVKTFLERHPARTGTQTELHLLHGNADFEHAYQELKATAVFGAEENAGITASHWFTARKRGLIAPFAVGTVDQCLLSVLQSRHMFVRLFGLAGKVVVIDEVHAYDTYSSTVLDRLLSWLRALNTSVILLSATLPQKRRTELLRAYGSSCHRVASVTYPCVIGVSANGDTTAEQVRDLPGRAFTLHVLQKARRDWWSTVADHLERDLAGGGCAACIVNTVGDAQALYTYLKNRAGLADTHVLLFHARFPLGQRMEIENQVETWFGKGSRCRPRKAILVATQVIEQSLDVDFDVMVTELAPVDLVLQRGGRLQRHDRDRPERFTEEAVLYCLSPELSDPTPDFGNSAFVYEPYILLKSALALRQVTTVQLPTDVEGLIAKVYGPDDLACPDCLRNTLQAWKHLAEGQERSESYLGKAASIPAPHDNGDECVLRELAHVMDDDELLAPARTRLARPTITFVPLHREQGHLYLAAPDRRTVDLNETPDRAQAQAILRQGVTISHPHWVKYFQSQPVPSGWAKSPLLKHCRVAELEDGSLSQQGLTLSLNPELGVVFSYLSPSGQPAR